jgi:thiol peroxidase
MKALARTHAGRADWFAVNATTSPELADAHDVTATPAVVLYRTGRPSRRWTGAEQAAAAETEIPAELSTDLESNRKGRPMPERSDLVTFKGNPLTLVGNELSVGDKAPAFTAVNTDLSPFDLAPMLGEKIIVISSVPSLDTSVCATQTRKFNEEAADIGDDVTIVTISMDLPFAQSRWCGAEGVKNLQVVSDHKDAAFGESYGMLIKELRLLARAVHVIDKSGKIVHRQIVGEMTDEPDYNAALEAVRAAK